MKVTVEYTAQVKRAAGIGAEELELDADSSIRDLVAHIADAHGDPLRGILLDAAEEVHPSLLLFVGDNQVRPGDSAPLSDRDIVTILSPISGG